MIHAREERGLLIRKMISAAFLFVTGLFALVAPRTIVGNPEATGLSAIIGKIMGVFPKWLAIPLTRLFGLLLMTFGGVLFYVMLSDHHGTPSLAEMSHSSSIPAASAAQAPNKPNPSIDTSTSGRPAAPPAALIPPASTPMPKPASTASKPPVPSTAAKPGASVPDSYAPADLLVAEAGRAWEAKEYDLAVINAEKALELYKNNLGPDHPKVAQTQTMIDAAKKQRDAGK